MGSFYPEVFSLYYRQSTFFQDEPQPELNVKTSVIRHQTRQTPLSKALLKVIDTG